MNLHVDRILRPIKKQMNERKIIIHCAIEHFSHNYNTKNECFGPKLLEFFGAIKTKPCPRICDTKKLCKWCGRNLIKEMLWSINLLNFEIHRCRATIFHTYWKRAKCNMISNNIVKCCFNHTCSKCYVEIKNRIDIICTLLCGRSMLIPRDIITHILVPLLRPKISMIKVAHLREYVQIQDNVFVTCKLLI